MNSVSVVPPAASVEKPMPNTAWPPVLGVHAAFVHARLFLVSTRNSSPLL